MKEKEELLKLIEVLEKETTQLREQVGRMERELNHEKERCDQLQAEQKVSCVLCNWSHSILSETQFFPRTEPIKMSEDYVLRKNSL